MSARDRSGLSSAQDRDRAALFAAVRGTLLATVTASTPLEVCRKLAGRAEKTEMRVLVTGHDGYIGAVLVPLLQRVGHDVVGVDTGLFSGCMLGQKAARETWIETGKGLFRQAPEKVLNYRRMALGLLLFCSLWPVSTVSAQPGPDFVRRARIIETPLPGPPNPAGVAFSRRANTFIVLQHIEPLGPPDADVILITHKAKLAGSRRIAAAITDSINMVFDDKAHRLLLYDADPRQIIEVRAGRDGLPDRGALTRIPAPHYGIGDAQGMAVDPMTGRLFILDSERPKIVVVEPDAEGGLREATASAVGLRPFGSIELRGIAFDPTSGHLHVFGPAEQRLYEITETGLVVATRDLSACKLLGPRGMVFAPSGDLTDDPSEVSLYIAESGTIGGGSSSGATTRGRITELSLIPSPQPRGTATPPRSSLCGRAAP